MQTIYDQRYRRVVRRLTGARHDSGLTQAQVAHTLGWRRTMLSNIETCERRADLLETYALCRVYGIQLSELEALLAQGDLDRVAEG